VLASETVPGVCEPLGCAAHTGGMSTGLTTPLELHVLASETVPGVCEPLGCAAHTGGMSTGLTTPATSTPPTPREHGTGAQATGVRHSDESWLQGFGTGRQRLVLERWTNP
jgi:hypothetical protein